MPQNLYPLSAQNQQYIPLDVIESRGYVKQSFLAAAPLATRLVPDDIEESLMLIRVTENAILDFATTDIGAIDSTKSFYLLANKDYVLAMPLEYIDLTGDGTAGIAIINYITKYDTLTIPDQLDQG